MRGDWVRPWLWAVVVAIAASCATSCTRGKSREERAETHAEQKPAASEAEGTPAPAQPAPADSADEAFREGKLPASVTEGTPVPGGELIVAIQSDPASLNVMLDADLVASWITRHRIYESLVNVDPYDDPRYQPIPELAERWEISDDKKTYTFHLRKDVKWHDGQPFTARDVVATFDKVMDERTKAVHMRSLLTELAKVTAPDDYTVVTTWKRPFSMTLDTLADVNIQPAHVIGKLTGQQYNETATNPLNRAPIGTGPFKFSTWESNNRITLARNDAYWGKKPYLDRLTFRTVADPTVRMQLAERGELDLLYGVTSEQWSRMEAPILKRDFNRSRFFPAGYAWIGWNAKRPYFADKRVRRALTMLVDRPGIISKMLYGLPRPTTCHFYWAGAQCDPALTPLPYDPTAAAALLDEAGWKDTNNDGIRDKGGKPFRFVFMLPSASVEAGRWVAKIKEDFARVGIAFDIQQVEWSAFQKRLVEHNFDACTLLWGGGPRSDPTQIWHSSAMKGGSNYTSYENREADKLIDDARVEFDDARRDEMYRKLGAMLHEDQPYTWMYVRPNLELLHKRIKGAKANLFWWQYESIWLDPALRRK